MTALQFNNQLEKIEDLLFGFAMKLTRNRDNAKDLMQETLMRSFDKRDRFKNGTNFKAWMTTIMYNSYVNHYRKRKTRNRVETPIEDCGLAISNKPAVERVQSVIMLDELKKMINALSDDYKTPFLMFFRGYHYDEIAETMDIPMGTVKSRIFYARKKLQEAVSIRYGTENPLRA